jgi:hypothetical protein
MKARLFYRIASVVLLLFTLGHTLGFRQVDPGWGVDGLMRSMQTIRFSVQGFSRTYWDFFVGFGLFVSVLQLFGVLVCWQLGSLEAGALRSLSLLRWSLVVCFAVVTFLCWRYFFAAPLALSGVTTICLALGAWLAERPA